MTLTTTRPVSNLGQWRVQRWLAVSKSTLSLLFPVKKVVHLSIRTNLVASPTGFPRRKNLQRQIHCRLWPDLTSQGSIRAITLPTETTVASIWIPTLCVIWAVLISKLDIIVDKVSRLSLWTLCCTWMRKIWWTKGLKVRQISTEFCQKLAKPAEIATYLTRVALVHTMYKTTCPQQP